MKNHHRSNVSLIAAMTLVLAAGCDDSPEAGEQLELSAEEDLNREAPGDDEDATVSALAADDIESTSFATERGISVEVAQLRLARQVLAPRLADAARRELGPAFGGAWIDVHDDDVIKVGVTTLGEREIEVVDRLAREVGLTGGYEAVAVRHSMAALESANEFLANGLIDVNPPEGASLTVGLRTDINAVELQAPIEGELSAAQERLVESARARFGELLVVGSYRGRPEARACTYPNCDPPLRGGIRISNSGKLCTGGFVARSNSDGKWYQFTAGHCAEGSKDNWSAAFTNKSAHVIGGVWNSTFGSAGDVAILTINNPLGWNPKPWVNVTAGPDTTVNSSYPVTSDSTALIGMRICTTGASYGRSDCGFVTQLGVPFNYGGGVVVKNLGRGSFCGTGGDSGAPMFASHVAYGLQVAGYSECDSLFQSIRAGELLMNVSVIHG